MLAGVGREQNAAHSHECGQDHQEGGRRGHPASVTAVGGTACDIRRLGVCGAGKYAVS